MTKGIDFGKQIGPLPLGAWVAAGAAGLAIGYAVNRRSKAAAAAAPVAPVGPVQGGGETAGVGGGTIDTGGVVALPNGAGASGSTVAGGGAATTSDRPVFTDNDAWSAYATAILVAKGYAPLAVLKAIADLMNGTQLDVQEQAMIDLVIRVAGAPPLAVPPITGTPMPTLPATPTAGAAGSHGTAVRTNYRDGALHTLWIAPGLTLPGYGGAGGHLWHEWAFADGKIHQQDLSLLLHLGPLVQDTPPVVNGNGPDGYLHVDVIGIDGRHNDIYWNGRAWSQRVLAA